MIESAAGGHVLVRADGATKVYGKGQAAVRALEGVSFGIREGEAFGLVGESGSGKSTLGRLVLGLERPTLGMIRFDGIDLANAPRPAMRQVRRQMQVVFQDPLRSLNRRKTVRQIVSAPMLVHGVGTRADRRARVREVLEAVQLGDRYLERYPNQLSGGQCQRIAIARALVLSPRFIVFDEAVSSVDVSVQGQLLNLLRQLRDDLRLAYLFISHNLAVVRYMTDNVAVMRAGRIVELAPRWELFTTPRHEYTRTLLDVIPEPPAAGTL